MEVVKNSSFEGIYSDLFIQASVLYGDEKPAYTCWIKPITM